jgi:hypothetical protein
MTTFMCRGCGASVRHTFADLGAQPLANAYLDAEALDRPEPTFPLHVRVCEQCFLVQLPELAAPEELFEDYAYLSSFSDSWLRHAEAYVEKAVSRLGLDSSSRVVEIASNDGYLLRNMVAMGIPALGIEPAANAAALAEAHGVPTTVAFFGFRVAQQLVDEGWRADLIVANNVVAHVPDLHDFVQGLAILLAPRGTITLEFPSVQALIESCHFDTIYHEHFSYLSLLALEPVLATHGLAVADAERLPTHGGSLRLWVQHDTAAEPSVSVDELRRSENHSGLSRLATYTGIGARISEAKCDLLDFLIGAHRDGVRVAGYGAPAKASTLLNYCGVGPELLAYTVDRNPRKQGRYLPGCRIPVTPTERIFEDRPERILILAWNIADEIIAQLAAVREWDAQLFVRAPSIVSVA